MAKQLSVKKRGMIDISAKRTSLRKAVAKGAIVMSEAAASLISSTEHPKGNVLATARVCGIMAAKQTPNWLVLCHPLLIEQVSVNFKLEQVDAQVKLWVRSEVIVNAKTGVEMEALCAVSGALLCVYDMQKIIDPQMQIGEIMLVHKSGGKSRKKEWNSDIKVNL